MKGRRFVWSDPRIIKLAKQFVATTDEVWRLDTSDEDDCRFFQKMADHGHYGHLGKDQSRQGTYVFTADGKFLSSINHLSADDVLETLQQGLAKWKQLPESERAAREPKVKLAPKNRWEDSYPHDGLVLSIVSRDIPQKAKPESDQLPTWNRDSAWFSKSESEQLVPRDAKVGDTFDLPAFFVNRLCKLHFVDSVKGQTEPFTKEQIAGSKIRGKVISKQDDQLELQLSGDTRGIRTDGRFKRGVETHLIGEAKFSVKTKRFSKFELVAIGSRWGMTRFNDRRRTQDRSPIGYTFKMARPNETIVTPGITWAYDAPWVNVK